jgi:heme A synthase
MLVALLCGVLLARGYKQSRQRLLLWSSICFLGIALHSGLIFVDLVMLPRTDLHMLRRGVIAVAMIVLLYGLIWDSE